MFMFMFILSPCNLFLPLLLLLIKTDRVCDTREKEREKKREREGVIA